MQPEVQGERMIETVSQATAERHVKALDVVDIGRIAEFDISKRSELIAVKVESGVGINGYRYVVHAVLAIVVDARTNAEEELGKYLAAVSGHEVDVAFCGIVDANGIADINEATITCSQSL